MTQWSGGSGGGGAVSSVFTRTGAVTAQTGDYTPAQVAAVPAAGLSGDLPGNAHRLTAAGLIRRVGSVASSATPTINTDNVDLFTITALAAAITSFTTNLSGTPADGQTLMISITDNGTARAITWGASFEASGSVPLPTTTVVSTRLDVGFIWNAATSKWRCVAAS